MQKNSKKRPWRQTVRHRAKRERLAEAEFIEVTEETEQTGMNITKLYCNYIVWLKILYP